MGSNGTQSTKGKQARGRENQVDWQQSSGGGAGEAPRIPQAEKLLASSRPTPSAIGMAPTTSSFTLSDGVGSAACFDCLGLLGPFCCLAGFGADDEAASGCCLAAFLETGCAGAGAATGAGAGAAAAADFLPEPCAGAAGAAAAAAAAPFLPAGC